MKVNLEFYGSTEHLNITTRCPHCGHLGAFSNLGSYDYKAVEGNKSAAMYILGVRRCPNVKCYGHLFFIADGNKTILETFPTETIPFDKENIPENVLNSFEEAIKCHSNNCFIAAGIMIRKTLEEICFEKGIQGNNLFQKLSSIGSKVTMPKELLEGINELRLLGNDAAHIEAKTFAEIGKEEIEISLEVTKEILKAVYQYQNLVASLKKLKEKNIQKVQATSK